MQNTTPYTTIELDQTLVKVLDESNNEVSEKAFFKKLTVAESKKVAKILGYVYISKRNLKKSIIIPTNDLIDFALQVREPESFEFTDKAEYENALKIHKTQLELTATNQ